jgi:hypothetical protein
MLLPSVPPWILAYLTAGTSGLYRITATMKVRGSQSRYENFTGDLRKSLTEMQCHSLEQVFFIFKKLRCIDRWPSFSNPKAAVFWAERSTAA